MACRLQSAPPKPSSQEHDMDRSSRLVLAGVACLPFVLSRATAARADHVIDAFSDAFPSVQCGSGPLWPFLWAGKWNGTANPFCTSSQSNLAGVLGRQRSTTVREPTVSNFVTASIVTETDGQHAISYATGLAPSGSLTLEYGLLTPLNLNLSADRAFELTVSGDMDDSVPTRPVKLTISVRSGTGSLISASLWIDHDGTYQVPFTAFSGVTFSDVDYVNVTIDGTSVRGVDYDVIGGVRTTATLGGS
jgi:hypothetical protein